jgi:hypothetical protein
MDDDILKMKKMKERVVLFLYILYPLSPKVNINTFKRYLYLYYISNSFFCDESDKITITVESSNIKIPYLNEILDDFIRSEFIEIDDNIISIKEELMEFVSVLLTTVQSEKGKFYELYMEIKPFVSLVNSYDDQFVFTLFFSEPTFKEANERNIEKFDSSSSVLTELLNKFKDKLVKENIDKYDILTYWMDFVLKNYYKVGVEDGSFK